MHHYDLGNRIYELRRAKQLSQKDLGNLVGVSNKAVSKWENGTAIPKTDTLVKLANVLGVSPQELLQGKTDDRITLAELSSQTNLMFLKEELEKRDREIKQYELSQHKRYLACLLPMFASVFVAVLLLSILTDSENPILPDALLCSFLVAYIVSAAFSGFVFLARNAKRLPLWALAIFGFFFPATLIITCFIGTAITPAYVINSLKGIFGNRENGYEKSK